MSNLVLKNAHHAVSQVKNHVLLMFQLLLIFPKAAMHSKRQSFILSMLFNLLPTEILTKYNVSIIGHKGESKSYLETK